MNKYLSRILLTTLLFIATTGASTAYERLTQEEIGALLQVRPVIFGGSEIQAALQQSTITGAQPPIFAYNAADRAIIAWKIDDLMAGSFAEAINLPPWMSLAKVSSITEKQMPRERGKRPNDAQPGSYFMLLDIANAERFVQGTIVEWKTFVTVGADPVPRLLRFDVQRAIPGVDLLDVFTPPFGAVEWRVSDESASGFVTDGTSLLDISLSLQPGQDPRDRRERSSRESGDMQKSARHRRFTEEFLTAGERVFSSLGSQARYYYDGSSVSAELLAIDPRSINITNTFPWAGFAGPLDSVSIVSGRTEHLVQPIGLPVEPGSGESILFAQLTGMVLGGASPELVFETLAQVSGSQSYPTLYYGVLHLYQALQIFSAQELPKLVFSLKPSPKTVFINFEIPQHKVRAFRDAFLPDHFELAKIRFYPEQSKPVYAISLNVYDAVGQSVSGFRAEWSTYVINPNEEDPQPRFSIIEAQTSAFGLDPLSALEAIKSPEFDPNDLFTLLEGPSDVFDFSLDEQTGLNIKVADFDEGIEVDVAVPYPAEEDILRTRPLREWMEANDRVYWGEVADILKYDSNVMYADMIVFEAGDDAVIKDNAFAEFIDPKPLPIILWDGVQDIALEPWGNLQDIVPAN
jgi:hypothetical protein